MSVFLNIRIVGSGEETGVGAGYRSRDKNWRRRINKIGSRKMNRNININSSRICSRISSRSVSRAMAGIEEGEGKGEEVYPIVNSFCKKNNRMLTLSYLAILFE